MLYISASASSSGRGLNRLPLLCLDLLVWLFLGNGRAAVTDRLGRLASVVKKCCVADTVGVVDVEAAGDFEVLLILLIEVDDMATTHEGWMSLLKEMTVVQSCYHQCGTVSRRNIGRQQPW